MQPQSNSSLKIEEANTIAMLFSPSFHLLLLLAPFTTVVMCNHSHTGLHKKMRRLEFTIHFIVPIGKFFLNCKQQQMGNFTVILAKQNSCPLFRDLDEINTAPPESEVPPISRASFQTPLSKLSQVNRVVRWNPERWKTVSRSPF